MSLNPGGNNYGWNYSKPDKPGYSTQLVGTVLAIQEVQKRGYTMNGQPGMPQFWPDGNPMMNIRISLATPEGELKQFTFQPAGKAARMGQKKSVHMDLFALTGNTDMMNLIGKTICIQTQEGRYGQGNPRPWFVSLVEGGPFELNMPLPADCQVPQVLADSAVSGGQINAPQQQPAYQQQYQPQQPVYQQPMQQQAYQPQPAYQPQQPAYQQPQMQHPAYQQPQMQQPAYQHQQPMCQQQPMQQGYPAGMDPAIAQAMATKAFGDGVQVSTEQPMQQGDPVGGGSVYDDDPDMPF